MVELFETCQKTRLYREMKEETGLDVEIIRMLYLCDVARGEKYAI